MPCAVVARQARSAEALGQSCVADRKKRQGLRDERRPRRRPAGPLLPVHVCVGCGGRECVAWAVVFVLGMLQHVDLIGDEQR